jgi:hypothetical protein
MNAFDQLFAFAPWWEVGLSARTVDFEWMTDNP